jgi:hypothetical protein
MGLDNQGEVEEAKEEHIELLEAGEDSTEAPRSYVGPWRPRRRAWDR